MTDKQTLRIPEREKYNWEQSVLHTCDFCNHYGATVITADGSHCCSSCCDAEYTTALMVALETAIKRVETAEKRIAELEAREVTLPAQKFCPDEYVGSVLWAESEIWNQAISECAKAIRAAGIGKEA